MRTRHEGSGVGKQQVLGVKEPGSPTRRHPTLGPSRSGGDAVALVLRPPHRRPLLAACMQHSPRCSLLFAVCTLLLTAAVPQSRYQSRDYWGSTAKVKQPHGCTIHAAAAAALIAAVTQSCYQSGIIGALQPKCNNIVAPLFMPQAALHLLHWRKCTGAAALGQSLLYRLPLSRYQSRDYGGLAAGLLLPSGCSPCSAACGQ